MLLISTGKVKSNIGACNFATTGAGPISLAWCGERMVATAFHALMTAHTSAEPATGSSLYSLEFDNTDHLSLGLASAGVAQPSTVTYPATDGLVIAGADWNATTANLHKFLFSSGAWTHQSAAVTNSTGGAAPGATGFMVFGQWEGADQANCRYACAAVWNRVLSTAEWELLGGGLSTWAQLNPKGLWDFRINDTASAVNDLTGGGANQVSASGTSIAAIGARGLFIG